MALYIIFRAVNSHLFFLVGEILRKIQTISYVKPQFTIVTDNECCRTSDNRTVLPGTRWSGKRIFFYCSLVRRQLTTGKNEVYAVRHLYGKKINGYFFLN